jgi:hypothetical protein
MAPQQPSVPVSGPYPLETVWTWFSTMSGFPHTSRLWLKWELDGSRISDDYTPDNTDAASLWRVYVEHVHWWDSFQDSGGWVSVAWFVQGESTFEEAPFVTPATTGGEPFVFAEGWADDRGRPGFTWPHQAGSGERLNWLRLPVPDQRWTPGTADKGGFVQEVSGWRPTPLLDRVHLRTLAKAAGLWWP